MDYSGYHGSEYDLLKVSMVSIIHHFGSNIPHRSQNEAYLWALES